MRLAQKAVFAEHILDASRTTVAAKRLTTVFRETNAVLVSQLDPLLAPLEETKPEFYARYRAVHEIVARPGTRATANAATPAVTPTPSTVNPTT